MRLESLAFQYFGKNKLSFNESYFIEKWYIENVPTSVLMSGIIQDLKKGKGKTYIAAKFHFSLVKLIELVAHHQKIKKITFSGCVFQNSLFVDLIVYHLKGKFDLFFHKELAPNDENISFGQLVCYQIQNTET